MATRRANHPGSDHGALKGARATNKKYVPIVWLPEAAADA